MPFTLVTVTATYKQADNVTPAVGSVTFQPTALMANEDMVAPTSVKAVLDPTGSISVQLPATDDVGTNPTGVTWKTTERIQGADDRIWYLPLPHAQTAVNLRTVAPALPASAAYGYALDNQVLHVARDWGGVEFNAKSVLNPGGAAKGDGKTDAGVVVTSGLNVASSATSPGPWSSADVGKLIVIEDPSSRASLYSGTIQSVTDAQHIILAGNASGTASGAGSMWASDDLVPLTNLITTLNAGGPKVKGVIPGGLYGSSGNLPTLTCAYASLLGDGKASTVIFFTVGANGDNFRVQQVPFEQHKLGQPWNVGPKIADFTLDGTGAGANANGFRYGDIIGGEVDVNVQHYNKAGQVGFWLNNASNYTERTRIRVSLTDCAFSFKVSKNDADNGTTSFARNRLELFMELNSGQKGIRFESAAGQPLSYYAGRIEMGGNQGGNGIFIELTGNAAVIDNDVDIEREGPTSDIFITLPSTATWRNKGIMLPGLTGSLAAIAGTGVVQGEYHGLGVGAANPGDVRWLIKALGAGGHDAEFDLISGSSWTARFIQTAASLLKFNNGGADRMTIDPNGVISLLDGHLETAGTAPTLGAQQTGINSQNISGSDMKGLLSVQTTGSPPGAASKIATGTFHRAYAATPVMLAMTPDTTKTFLFVPTGTGTFDLYAITALAPNTWYGVGYLTIG